MLNMMNAFPTDSVVKRVAFQAKIEECRRLIKYPTVGRLSPAQLNLNLRKRGLFDEDDDDEYLELPDCGKHRIV